MGWMSSFKKFFDLDDEMDMMEQEDQEEERSFVEKRAERRETAPANVVSLSAVQRPTKVMVMHPRGFADVQAIADHLKNRRPVVFYIGEMRTEEARRLIDFLSGAVYALNGHIQKIAPDTFICAPDHIDINGAITEALKK
ncbi:cell division protein SepF [Caenibacillus caldisaponilyticus]|uniref:cell division protein SepF n=1 Tax=Caenibacillus caldisaponilyticus TaxID=1674942 RepID=UPI0009889249|nr:cell division protein SepF [Caenibacillus caldisaponilyticus]